jgi:muramoyltetrapeptide carboxypeptidase
MHKTRILKPPKLLAGKTVGLIAPAGPVTRSELQPGIDFLTSQGYGVSFGKHLYKRQDYTAGSDNVRLLDLHTMFEDRDVGAIICARGGYGTLRLLDKIDYAAIRNNPKPFVGYSDITALLMAIHKRTGLITFHGSMLKDSFEGKSRNLASALDLVSAPGRLGVSLEKGEVLRSGRAQGALFGGNLSIISRLIGTSYLPSLKGALLFMEERGESLYRIDRMLTHLKLSGLLDDVGAVLAGDFAECGDMASIKELLLESTGDLDIPVVTGMPVGHGAINGAVPIGLTATMDTDTMTLAMSEPCVI